MHILPVRGQARPATHGFGNVGFLGVRHKKKKEPLSLAGRNWHYLDELAMLVSGDGFIGHHIETLPPSSPPGGGDSDEQ